MNIKSTINTTSYLSKVRVNQDNVLSQKLPRFLYHFTSAESAKEILNDGVIHTSFDGRGIEKKGVFMVDFQNLIKNWSKFFVMAWSKEISLLTCLLGQATKGDDRIACFRIPTQTLMAETVIRSQNELKRILDSGEDTAPYFSKGEKYKLFQRNGHSIEYIHFGEIKVDKTNLVGVASLTKNLYEAFNKDNFNELDLDIDSITILKSLFAKQPEINTLESFRLGG